MHTLVPCGTEVLHVRVFPAAVADAPAVTVTVLTVPGTNRTVHCSAAGAAPPPRVRFRLNTVVVPLAEPSCKLAAGCPKAANARQLNTKLTLASKVYLLFSDKSASTLFSL